jgi:branched-subunit amino acid aminotransferase/4-amino-4-deoxychorismate lyase
MTNPTSHRHPAGTDRPTSSSSPRPIAWADGRVVPASEATVPLTDEGFLRGDAVFDAMLVRKGHTHAMDAHLARLRRSAQALDLRVPVLRQVVTDLLAAWGERDGVLRLIVTRGGNVRGLLTSIPTPPAQSLMVVQMPWRSALTRVKTLSYAANQWATRQAVKREADDALIVDDGHVLELPTGAICLVHDGTISAPDHERLPILDSITLAELRKVTDITPTTPTLDDVRSADELFVVSAARPVMPVDSVLIDDEQLTFPSPGPVTRKLQAAFDEHVLATLDPRA